MSHIIPISDLAMCPQFKIKHFSINQDCALDSHIKKLMQNKKKLQCIWCSCVSLDVKKTFLKCKECKKKLWRDNNWSYYWSNHMCFIDIFDLSKSVSKKLLVGEIIHNEGQFETV